MLHAVVIINAILRSRVNHAANAFAYTGKYFTHVFTILLVVVYSLLKTTKQTNQLIFRAFFPT